MFLIELVCATWLLIKFIDCHGGLTDPSPRNENYLNGQYNNNFVPYNKWDLRAGAFDGQHLMHGGKYGDCGDEYGNYKFAPNGPITKTYYEGQKIKITTYMWRPMFHGGYIEIKICVLKHLGQWATQECFDRNPLELVDSTRIIKNDPYKATIDDSETELNKIKQETSFDIWAQLPPGLKCEHCVLQWAHHSSFPESKWPNGTIIKYDLGSQFFRQYIPRQRFINCADIRINANPSLQSNYKKPSPPALVPLPKDKIFQCVLSGGYSMHDLTNFYAKGREIVKNDPLKYTGIGVTCWTTRWKTQDEFNKNPNWWLLNEECKICHQNCISPDKKCPDSCICQWFNWV